MSGITISALAGVNTILGPEEIPLVQNGATSTVTPTLLAAFFAGVNTSGTVRSVNVAGGSSGLTFTGGPITSSGTITMGGALVPASGGTGLASYAVGDLLYATAATTLSKLAGVATGNALISGGVTTAPLWGKVGLATHVSGVLTTGNGGTNTTSASTGSGGIVLSSGPSIASPTLTTPTLISPVLGVVTSGNVTACTGAVAQVVSTITGAVATGTTTIAASDTIPTNTTGDQYMSVAITPRTTTSKLIIDVTVHQRTTNAANHAAALFQDSTANALAVGWAGAAADIGVCLRFMHVMTAATTTTTTFKVRSGTNVAGTTTFNGAAGGRFYGGVLASSIVIREIIV